VAEGEVLGGPEDGGGFVSDAPGGGEVVVVVPVERPAAVAFEAPVLVGSGDDLVAEPDIDPVDEAVAFKEKAVVGIVEEADLGIGSDQLADSVLVAVVPVAGGGS
jgi:hypothetical protein